MIRSSRATDKIDYTIGSSESSKYCARFEEVANDVMEGAERRISFLLGKCDKLCKFRIFGFFFKGRETKRKINMTVGVKFLELGYSYKDFRG